MAERGEPRKTPGETRRKVFEFVRDRLREGAPPTVREVQQAFGFRSVESARAQLEALVEGGLLVKTPGKSRSYRVPSGRPGGAGMSPAAPATALVPLLGRVQAGALVTALQEPDGYVTVDTGVEVDKLFALRVRGESMRDLGILPGDLVIVRAQPSAEPGDVVVALVSDLDDEATIKTLRRETLAEIEARIARSGTWDPAGGPDTGLQRPRWVLQPANPEFEPIVPEPDTLQILGKVIELRRSFA